jgi:hypothetical protein
MTASRMTWRARFLDGPCVRQEHVWAVGPPWQEIRLAKLGAFPGTEFKIVGGDGIPGSAEPWPTEAHYLLDRLEDDQGETVAWYRLLNA